MQRIPTADGRFLAGNPQTGLPGTIVTSKFMNDIQDEICNVIVSAGLELNGEKQTQLYEAIGKLLTDAAPKAATENLLGLARIATIEQALALKDDGVMMTPKKLADVFGGVNQFFGELFGWQVLPGRLLLQWCFAETIMPNITESGAITSTKTNVTVTFPIAFSSVQHVIVTQGAGTVGIDRNESGEMAMGLSAFNDTTATATVMRVAGSNGTSGVPGQEVTRVNFFAIGMA